LSVYHSKIFMSSKSIRIEKGSGNVFADIGVRDPEESLARAKLAKELTNIINQRGLTQTEIARLLGIDQPKVSKLLNGRISGFASDRLLRFILALGSDVKIEIRRNKGAGNRHGKLRVVAA